MSGRCSSTAASGPLSAAGSRSAHAGVRSGEESSKTRAMQERQAADTSLRVLSRTPCASQMARYSG